MKLIVGLGNPGEKYEKTRHNLGYMVVDRFLQDIASVKETKWQSSKKFHSLISEHTFTPKFGDLEKVILAKPQTFMNESGESVEALASFYKIEPFDVLVVHDELDLPSGSMKIRKGGSGAGHHGVEDIMEKLGTEMFWRFRMGIGMSKNHGEIGGHLMHNVDDFVLGNFEHDEIGRIRELIKRGSHALKCALEDGMEAAQHQFNTK